MYNKVKSYVNDYEVLTYKNIHSGNSFSIVPAFGALLTSIVIGAQELLDGPENAELGKNPGFKGALLAPFANRVNHGAYSFLGETYNLPINEKARDHAIHGFIYRQKFELIKDSVTSDHVLIELKSSYIGEKPGYPFPFDSYFKVKFDEKEGLTCSLRFINTGKTDLPIVAGWHPYYMLRAPVDRLLLKLPSGRIIEVDERMIPTGRMMKYDTFSQLKPVGRKSFDNIFKLEQADGEAIIILSNPENDTTIEAWQETELFKYWVIYTPPGRKSIAIEPMTGNIDAFNNREGLIIIKPGNEVSGRFGVRRIK